MIPIRRDTYHDHVSRRESVDRLHAVLVVEERKQALLTRSGYHQVSNATFERWQDLRSDTAIMRVTFDSSAWTGRQPVPEGLLQLRRWAKYICKRLLL